MPVIIGSLNERSLHAQLKEYYSRDGDEIEALVGTHFADILRNDTIIEIQIGNFSVFRRKAEKLLEEYKVHMVYPIAQTRWIVRVDEDGTEIERSKSRYKEKPRALFRELIRMPYLLAHPGFSIEIAMVEAEEVRCDDGKGSWRRKGMSIVDRRLVQVLSTQVFDTPRDLLNLIPPGLETPFSSKSLKEHWGGRQSDANKALYCLSKCGAIRETIKDGRLKMYEFSGVDSET